MFRYECPVKSVLLFQILRDKDSVNPRQRTRTDGSFLGCESSDKTCEYEGPNATSDVLIQKTYVQYHSSLLARLKLSRYLQNLEDRLQSLEHEIGNILSESNELTLTEHEGTSEASTILNLPESSLPAANIMVELPFEAALHSPDDHWTCYGQTPHV